MSTTRQMIGTADFTGRTVNTLQIGQLIGRRPEPKYRATCKVCGTVSTETQGRIRSGAARCLNSGCGKDRIREIVNDTPAKARKRAEAAEQEKRREREKREAADLEATQAEFEKLNRDVALTVRERLTKGRDDEFRIDPATFTPITADVPVDDWNREEIRKFLETNPAYYPCQENLKAMTGYILRNAPHIKLVSALQLEWAYKRLNEYGLLKQQPAPEPEKRAEPVRVNLTIAPKQPEQPRGPKVYIGRDWETGEERQFTEREVNRMSSLEYKRAFPIAPTVAELLTAMEEQR